MWTVYVRIPAFDAMNKSAAGNNFSDRDSVSYMMRRLSPNGADAFGREMLPPASLRAG